LKQGIWPDSPREQSDACKIIERFTPREPFKEQWKRDLAVPSTAGKAVARRISSA